MSKRVSAGDLQCHLLLILQPTRLNSLLFPHLNMTPPGLISRHLFVFLINDHSAEITVRCIFGKDKPFQHRHTRKKKENPIHQIPSFKCTKRLHEQDIVRCLTFCVGGKSDSKSSTVVSPMRKNKIKKKSAWKRSISVVCCVTSCSAVLHFTDHSQQIHQDASCFYNTSYFVRLLSR